MRPLRIATPNPPGALDAAHDFFEGPRAAELFDALKSALPEATDEDLRGWMRAIARNALHHRLEEPGDFNTLFEAGHAALLSCIAQMRGDGDTYDAPRSRLARRGLWWVRQGVLKKLAELQPPAPEPKPHVPLTEALIGLLEEVLDERALENLFTLAARGEGWATDTLLRHYRLAIARTVRQLAPAGTDVRGVAEEVTRRLRHSIPRAGRPPRVGWMLEGDVRKALGEGPRGLLSQEQTARLNVLNNLLHPLAQALVDEACRLHAEYRQSIGRDEGFARDYELNIEVAYFAPPDFGDAVYRARTFSVAPEDFDGRGSLLTDPTDWKPWHTYPDLDKPYCYILHDLLKHSPLSLERVCEIEEVWGEVNVWGRKFVMVTENA